MAATGPNDPEQHRPSLVWSKLLTPVDRPRVSRRALVDLCAKGARKLTVIRAPAGWGKSTLLADWYALEGPGGRPFAWVSLDHTDNDPVMFWSYVIAALNVHDPHAGELSSPLLNTPRLDMIRELLPTLCNELATLPPRTVLVLDDLHVISNEAIHHQLDFFLRHLPSNLELALATRSQPALPLARLRARGELVEVDATQLSFSRDEADQLLNGLHGLTLESADVDRLRQVTEGWAAGLYLATLTMRRAADSNLVRDFAGNDRYIVDFFSTEVLAGLDDDTREFLLQTSVLERFSPSLCDAVALRDDSAQKLAELETSNFFLVPLDTRREWYRYHALFVDLLRRELTRSHPCAVAELHRRASNWHRNFGGPPEAIAHASAAGDIADASNLIFTHWRTARDRAQFETLLDWLDGLPADVVEHDERLCLVRATTLQEIGRIDEADRWIAAAEQRIERGARQLEPEQMALVALGLAASRAINSYFMGDAAAIVRTVDGVLARDARNSDYWDSVLYTTLGAALFVRGDPQQAALVLDRALATGRRSGHTLAAIHAFGWAIVARDEVGDRGASSELLAQADAFLDEHIGMHAYYGTAMIKVAKAKLLHRGGRLDEASTESERGVVLAAHGNALFELAYGCAVAAEVARSMGDRARARDRIREARRAATASPDCGQLSQLIEVLERELEPSRPVAAPFGEVLSEREIAVLRMFPTELSQREIAEALFVSFNTVKSHAKSIFRKLGVSSRSDAVARARELGAL
jgi:LuxR family transcriptional regulator, maltose regulon positive regulatory protein